MVRWKALQERRARFRRPGPRGVLADVRWRERHARAAVDRRPPLVPESLHELDLPPMLPGEQIAVTDQYRRVLWYDIDGNTLPDMREDKAAFLAAMRAWEADRKAGRHRIGHTRVHHRGAHLTVSTVLLGLDHGMDGLPRLFETMVFAGETMADVATFRYATKNAARHGHATIVAHLRACYAELRPPRRLPPPAPPHPVAAAYGRRHGYR